MSFAQFHDGFYRNVKVRRAGSAAAWMWAASIGYASETMTDGFVPLEVLNELSDLDSKPRLKLAAKLVEVGLWEPCEGGWMIHDYLKWNLSRDVINARREANLARVNKHRTNAVNHREGNARVMHYNAGTSAVSNRPPSVPLNLGTSSEDTKTLSPAPLAATPLPAQPTVTGLPLDLGAPTKAKKPRASKPVDPPPFSMGEAFEAIAAAAGGRFAPGVEGDWMGGVRIAVAKHIRAYPDLAAWRTLGEWLAAGGDRFRGTLGPSWAASGALPDAMARSREWAAKGGGVVDGRGASPARVEEPDPWVIAAAKAGVKL